MTETKPSLGKDITEKRGRPRHIAAPGLLEETQELVIMDRFLSVPSFAEHNIRNYSREQIISAVMGYVLTGSSKKAAQISGVADGTIRKWKCTTAWWDDCVRVAREILSEKLEDKFTGLLSSALAQLENRLDKGDTIVRDGELVNIPVRAAELGRLLGTLFDRRQLIRGDVTSRSETKSSSRRLDELREAAEQIIRDTGT